MSIHFSPDDWRRALNNYTAWWNHQLDRPLIVFDSVFDPASPVNPAPPDFLTNCPLSTPPQQLVEQWIAAQSHRRYVADSIPNWFVNFGAGVLAVPLGSTLTSSPETVWFDPVPSATIENLHITFNSDNPWWQRILDFTATACQMIGSQVQLSYTDLGGNLDVLASLISTESLLTDVLDDPDRVLLASKNIRTHWLHAFHQLDNLIAPHSHGRKPWAPTFAPGSTYMLQSDFSYMISPDMFNIFVKPDLVACCEHIDFPFYHMDGPGQLAHLDSLLSIPKLRGIQWVPGAGQPIGSDWPDILKRIRDAGKLCQVAVDRPGARRIIAEHNHGKGFLLQISEPLTESQALDFAREIDVL